MIPPRGSSNCPSVFGQAWKRADSIQSAMTWNWRTQSLYFIFTSAPGNATLAHAHPFSFLPKQSQVLNVIWMSFISVFVIYGKHNDNTWCPGSLEISPAVFPGSMLDKLSLNCSLVQKSWRISQMMNWLIECGNAIWSNFKQIVLAGGHQCSVFN